jgi:Protein of unknown function (DUF2815)
METSEKMKQTFVVLTPEFRVSFPNVFEKRAAAPGQEPKYSITMLFQVKTDPKAPKDAKIVDLAPIMDIVRGAIVAKFGADKAKWPKLRLPFRKGEEKTYNGYNPGIIFCAATSKMKPGVVDQNVKDIIEPNEFYPGCYARAKIAAFVYNTAGNQGVGLGLRNVQKIRDGEPLGGASSPQDDFDAIPMSGNGQEVVSATDLLEDIGA